MMHVQTTKLHRWWVSWYAADAFEYDGPWWITGSELGRNGRDTICAAVKATDADTARAVIVSAHDNPAVGLEWRFVESRPADWSPFGDRFERADWMCWGDQ